MRAVDIAVFMWILQLSLFTVGSVTGVFTVNAPEALFTPDIYSKLMTYVTSIVSAIVGAALVYKLLGLGAGTSILAGLGIMLGLVFFGKTLWYTFNIGSTLSRLLATYTGGYVTLPYSMEWGLNILGYVLGFIALMDWVRGAGSRGMG